MSGVYTVMTKPLVPVSKVKEFEEWMNDYRRTQAQAPGQKGVTVLGPDEQALASMKDGDDVQYIVLSRFDSLAALRAWIDSRERGGFLARAKAFIKNTKDPNYWSVLERIDEVFDSGTWMTLTPPSETASTVPKYRFAVILLSGAYVLRVMYVVIGIPAYLVSKTFFVFGLFVYFGLFIVPPLTYLIMPLHNTLASYWLSRPRWCPTWEPLCTIMGMLNEGFNIFEPSTYSSPSQLQLRNHFKRLDAKLNRLRETIHMQRIQLQQYNQTTLADEQILEEKTEVEDVEEGTLDTLNEATLVEVFHVKWEWSTGFDDTLKLMAHGSNGDRASRPVGLVGVDVISGQESDLSVPYTVVYRFSHVNKLNQWLSSASRLKLLRAVEPMLEETAHAVREEAKSTIVRGGYSELFKTKSKFAQRPPVWKEMVLTTFGVWLTVTPCAYWFTPWVEARMNLFLAMFVSETVNVLSVVYIGIPFSLFLFCEWLYTVDMPNPTGAWKYLVEGLPRNVAFAGAVMWYALFVSLYYTVKIPAN